MLLQGLMLSNIFSQVLLPGSQVDNHNCALDGGYSWCESSNSCVRIWETPCEDNFNNCDDCLNRQKGGENIACPTGCDYLIIDPIPPIAVDPMPLVPVDRTPCPDVMCMMYCANGNRMDENGCDLCECNYDENTVPDCELVQPSCQGYNFVCPKITEITSCNEGGIDGHTTFRVSFILKDSNIKNIYAIFGDSESSRGSLIPPSYQVSRGVNIGGVQAYLGDIIPDIRFDSWLTIGITDGDIDNQLSAIGIDFDNWDEDTGLNIENGAVFAIDPMIDIVTSNEYVVGQFTVLTGLDPEIILNVQGKTIDSSNDKIWTEDNIRFNLISPRRSDGVIPNDCVSWYDGCNTCEVSSGVLNSCTRIMCFRNDNPRCLSYSISGH
jgi:hypothetical protein